MPLQDDDSATAKARHQKSVLSDSRRFRFKRTHAHDGGGGQEKQGEMNRHHRHRRHHHRNKRHKTSAHDTHDAFAYEDPAFTRHPDAAFRESLFDAMADDEGATFWEGVYGQPIHNYSNTYENAETGELEQMDDEEYAAFVRQKMWEKSREGIEASREERKREKERDKQRMRDQERAKPQRSAPEHDSGFMFDIELENSLRRGEQRQNRQKWRSLWDKYLASWDKLRTLHETRTQRPDDSGLLALRNQIAWPVESGKRKDVSAAEIERFVNKCVESLEDDRDPSILPTVVKTERVRWHPDKIQQRYGFMEIDSSTMQGVTAVFQIFDHIWGELRQRQA